MPKTKHRCTDTDDDRASSQLDVCELQFDVIDDKIDKLDEKIDNGHVRDRDAHKDIADVLLQVAGSIGKVEGSSGVIFKLFIAIVVLIIGAGTFAVVSNLRTASQIKSIREAIIEKADPVVMRSNEIELGLYKHETRI